ncbi:increased rDNA silencing protein 4 [Colletotrichum tofieldiae]|uniref:Increased rDNA silencing protein 4 n=1 Tax=Colletotrichum tofieldiae TaxID=708197 RepID=A0A161V511_9PEZI|nr:increased rDNA silencing protein 4 [Colletotrichum tofieldiae]GKT53987.1 increased rDNA silencing protein 4 [Colletotrichum tofieldiae]GKT73720.1 increased rDNA silencing protein 4 [Colletotrichum tofieldiae]
MITNAHHHHHNHHPSPAGGGGGGASDAAAALKGANLAFSKTKPRPIPPPKPTTGRRRGASLVAASTASSHDRSTSTSPVQRQHTGTSLATTPGDRDRFGRDGTADMRDRLSNFLGSSPAAAGAAASAAASASHLTPHTRLDPKSPSYIAATLAASRSASPSPQPHASPASLTPAQLNQLHQMQNARLTLSSGKRGRRGSGGSSSVVSSLDLPDTSSIPATGHLITMFEKGGEDVDPVKRSGGEAARPRVRPLTPERELSPSRAKAARMGIVEEEEERSGVQKPAVLKPKPRVKPRPVTPTPVAERASLEEETTPQAKKLAPKPVKPLLSPARVSHRRSESEQLPPARKTQPTVTMSPIASEAPEMQSKSRLTRVPITQTTRPEPKAPPATPEPRRSRPMAQHVAPSSPRVITRAETEVVSPKPTRPASKAKLRPPTPPQPRGTGGKSREPDAPPLTKPRSMASVYGHGPLQEPFRRPESEGRPSTADTSSSNDTFVSAESGQTAVPAHSLARPSPRPTHSAQSTPGRSSANSSPSRTTPRRTPAPANANLPLNSLSNAIMAGSLAAARLTPSNTGNSALSPPPLPSRTKSPRMRQTLRQPPSKSDDEDEIRKKKHQRAGNKHSHREGARRRWRDEITLRERRRYEAVWASNRGALLAPSSQPPEAAALPPDAGDCVANVVVREIWRRSRLPAEELAEVWDLVDRGRRGMLGKAEFVVGMWLIDQRLRGRKIPMKVSASVWNSAQGVNVPPPKAKK